MKLYKLEDKEIKVPTSYSDVSFKKYTKIFTGKPIKEIEAHAILVDVDLDTWSRIKMGDSYRQFIKDIEFIKKPINIDLIPPRDVNIKGKTVQIPFDIGNATTAQYSDLRELLNKDTNANILMACAIYLQPLLDGYYNINKAKELVKDIEELPCDLVFCLGGFFLSRALGLKNGYLKTYQKAGTRMQKYKQVMSSIRKHLAL